MNVRIRELAMQADIWCDQNVAQGSPMYNNQWETKFAELIVKECASLFPLAFTDEQYPRRIDKTIRKHFGIEV